MNATYSESDWTGSIIGQQPMLRSLAVLIFVASVIGFMFLIAGPKQPHEYAIAGMCAGGLLAAILIAAVDQWLHHEPLGFDVLRKRQK
jgi:membrane associated rhomboid family serine protease